MDDERVLTTWHVTIEAASEHGDEVPGGLRDALGRLLDLLDQFAPALIGPAVEGPPRYGAMLSIPADTAATALQEALHVFVRAAEESGLPSWPIAHVEVMTDAELDASLGIGGADREERE